MAWNFHTARDGREADQVVLVLRDRDLQLRHGAVVDVQRARLYG